MGFSLSDLDPTKGLKKAGSAIQSGFDQLTGKAGERAAEKAASTQAEAYGQGIDEQRRQFDLSREDMSPWMEAGQGALGLQQDFLGLSGQDAQSEAYANYQESPGQKFLRDRGEKAIQRRAAGTGNAGGGAVLSALNKQGIGFAAQDFGNYYNRLAGVSGTGQAATQSIGQLGANTASNVSNLMGQQGNARASGILGGQQSKAQGMSNLIGIGSMMFGGPPTGGGGLTTGTANQIASYDFS